MNDGWFYQLSTSRQLAELAGEIDMLLRHDERFNIRKNLRDKGPTSYGEQGGWTYTIKELFDWIREDPKNKELLKYLDIQEEQLISYLYDDTDILLENIQTFVDNCTQKYIEEKMQIDVN